MDITIFPGKLNGTIDAIPSKSHAHRVLICAALADRETEIHCGATSKDIEATVSCLNALNAKIIRTKYGFHVTPIQNPPATAKLPCGESGTTLRFILPIVGALGVNATFFLEGKLAHRPLWHLCAQMENNGCTISRPTDNTLLCTGKLKPSTYYFPGNISSQYISGMLLAMPLLKKDCQILIEGQLESQPYVSMTLSVMQQFGVNVFDYKIDSKQTYTTPGPITIEGDWSNAAFFFAAKAMGNQIEIHGLNPESVQGDRCICKMISEIRAGNSISTKDIPDLIPILSLIAAVSSGAVFTDVDRLRFKESDRVKSIGQMLCNLGIQTEETESELVIHCGQLHGGIVDSCNDHRIAMAAAIAATAASNPVTILNANCVEKSYPSFWTDYAGLGGKYEQYIRP